MEALRRSTFQMTRRFYSLVVNGFKAQFFAYFLETLERQLMSAVCQNLGGYYEVRYSDVDEKRCHSGRCCICRSCGFSDHLKPFFHFHDASISGSCLRKGREDNEDDKRLWPSLRGQLYLKLSSRFTMDTRARLRVVYRIILFISHVWIKISLPMQSYSRCPPRYRFMSEQWQGRSTKGFSKMRKYDCAAPFTGHSTTCTPSKLY